MGLIALIYKKYNRPQPIFYLEIAHRNQANYWVRSSKKASDLITSYPFVIGFEHPIVVIFNERSTFDHNMAMRSTGIVVVVDIPYNPWRKKCFNPSGKYCEEN